EVLRDEPPDFVVAFSSLATVLGGLGHAAYAAANASMEALAHEVHRTTRIPCVAVAWDAWRFGDAEAGPGLGADLAKLALSPEEGISALERILDVGVRPLVTVSAGDLQARIDRWVALRALHPAGEAAGNGAGRHERPGLTIPYAPPRNELEEALVETWQELLAIEQVGIHDNFFELGGHSLVGVQLNARLRRMFEVDLPLRALFDSPTVAELADTVENALIGEIDALSEEEAEMLLESDALQANVDPVPVEDPSGGAKP
ncbi:MAG TPA: phosphopantetheine-binding protein, partial [Thermoanaerobaculia bacterium]|nr:phosphopantetheine-binding protein [Thermoanaerobaculia bacterium]